jgi:hypothetical protein
VLSVRGTFLSWPLVVEFDGALAVGRTFQIEHDGHGRGERVMDDVIIRVWENLGGRLGGPLSFRLALQPLVATVLAVRAGMDDARAGRPAYFWTVLTDGTSRRELLHEGWKAVAKIFSLAIVIDTAYQLLVFRWVYPGELLIVAFLLACVPYLLMRGPVNRILAARRRPDHS